jgi:DNA-binding MarR family transcriptional regulator
MRQAAITVTHAGRDRITFMLRWSPRCGFVVPALTAGIIGARYGHMSAIGKGPGDNASDHTVGDTQCNCAAIRQAARRVTRLYDQALAPAGLRITQYPILVWLASAGPVTMSVLADRMVMDRATLGHNLRPLEARGLVTIVAGEDRRSRVVTLTEAGRRTLREARPAWRDAQQTFEAAFGPEDSASLRATMVRLARMDFSG